GSPFLSDARLQSLLDEAQLVLPPAAPTPSWRSRDSIVLRDAVTDWATRVAEAIRVLLAGWSRPWRGGIEQQVLRRRV
ncbi:MAG: hypothetical protein ACREMX_10695, partial [Gemmatimonadales bacterium]